MIIDCNLVKRVSRMDNKALKGDVAIFHFDESSFNHKTVCIPSIYLSEKLRDVITNVEPGEDIEWIKFLREYKLLELLNV